MPKPPGRFARLRRLLGRLVLLLVVVAAGAGAVAWFRSGNECDTPGTRDVAGGVRAWTACEYGGPEVLTLSRVTPPTASDSEVVVRVSAVSVNPADWHFMRGTPYLARLVMGVRKPATILMGTDFAGVVESVGQRVTRVQVGDSVWGAAPASFAERIAVRESRVVKLPPGVTLEEAAGVPIAAVTALQGVRDKGGVRAGHKVLVNGASGGVGTYAVQVARALGAEVTGVASGRNAELVRSIGATHTIDYTKEDFTQGTTRYDVIVDMVGNHSFGDLERVLQPGGRYVMIGGPAGAWLDPLPRLAAMTVAGWFKQPTFTFFVAGFNQPDLDTLGAMLGSGRLRTVIDRRYPFEEMPRAIEYLEGGRARGKVIVTR